MSNQTPLQYIIRVKDDGSAVIERFNRNITQGLNQVPPAANNAANSVNNLNNSLNSSGRAAANANASAQNLKKSWLVLSAQAYILNSALGFIKRSVESSISGFNKYEDSVSRLRALTLTSTGEMSKGFIGLKNQAVDMSNKFRQSATEVTQAMSFMKQFGLTEEQVSRGIKGTVDLATNELLSVQQAARIALQVQTSLGEGSGDLTRALDVLTVASAESGASLTDMGEAWKYVGVNSRLQGVSLEQTGAALMVLADAGIRGSMAGTTLRAALTRLDRPTGDAKKALQELGLVTATGQKHFNNFIDVLERLEGVGNKSSFINRIFGLRATTGLTAMTDSLGKFQEGVKTLQEAEGRNAMIAAEMNKGLAGATDRLVNSMENLKNAIVEQLSPNLISVANYLAVAAEFWAGKMVSDPAGKSNKGEMVFGAGWAGNNEDLLQFEREYLKLKENASKTTHGAAALREFSQGVTLPGIRGVKNWNWKPPAEAVAREEMLMKAFDLAKGAYGSMSMDMVSSMLPASSNDMSFLTKAANKVQRANFSGTLPSFVTREQDAKSAEKAQQEAEKAERERVERMTKISEDIRNEIGRGQQRRRDSGMYELEAMKAEHFMPESELELLAERMDSVNSIFANAANAQEQIMFEQSSRSHANILRLTKIYSDAAKNQVNIERAKQGLLFGIAFEGVKAMTDVFVHGNEGRFKAMKAIASAEALVNTYLAVTQVLATPGLDPFTKTATATAIGAIGLAKVASINQTEMGSTGGGSADSGLSALGDFSGGGFENPFVSSPSGSDVVLNGSGRAINVNINVDGFVGSEANLASKISEVLREAVGDDLNPGLTISRGRRS